MSQQWSLGQKARTGHTELTGMGNLTLRGAHWLAHHQNVVGRVAACALSALLQGRAQEQFQIYTSGWYDITGSLKQGCALLTRKFEQLQQHAGNLPSKSQRAAVKFSIVQTIWVCSPPTVQFAISPNQSSEFIHNAARRIQFNFFQLQAIQARHILINSNMLINRWCLISFQPGNFKITLQQCTDSKFPLFLLCAQDESLQWCRGFSHCKITSVKLVITRNWEIIIRSFELNLIKHFICVELMSHCSESQILICTQQCCDKEHWKDNGLSSSLNLCIVQWPINIWYDDYQSFTQTFKSWGPVGHSHNYSIQAQ